MSRYSVLLDSYMHYVDCIKILMNHFQNNLLRKEDLVIFCKLKCALFYDCPQDFNKFAIKFNNIYNKHYTELLIDSKNIFNFIYENNCYHICAHIINDQKYIKEFFELTDKKFVFRVLDQLLYEFSDANIKNLILYVFFVVYKLDNEKCNTFLEQFFHNKDFSLYKLGYRLIISDNYADYKRIEY